MRKWDEQRKQRNYETKIINARSVVGSKYATTKMGTIKLSRETDFSSHASQRSEKNDFKDLILFKQLQEYNLQQYTQKLQLRGYGDGLQLLAQKMSEYQNQILDELKLLPGHKQKFLDLLKNIPELEKPLLTPDNQIKRFTTGQTSFAKFNNTRELTLQRRQSQNHLSPYREGQIKQKILPKLPQRKLNNISSEQIQNERMDTKSSKPIKHKRSVQQKRTFKAQDDLILIHHYNGEKITTQIKENKLLKNLEKITGQSDVNINLQIDQIKLMYQSFDNAKLASTLVNLDIEEICNCLSATLKKMITITDLLDQYNQNEFYSDDDQIETQQIEQEPVHIDLLAIQEQTFEQSVPKDFESRIEYDDDAQDYRQSERLKSEQESRFQQTKSKFSIDSDDSIDLLQQFQIAFTDYGLSNTIPSIEVISNFCKNIMVTTKMEREVVIISLIYIERLISNKGLELNTLNWQRILFTSLVLASKIWDDESFENNNFAKVLPQFTTVQINEMEKVFLRYINYNLYIKQGDYAKYYFILRTYADKHKRSFPLRQLDLQTVMLLQKKTQQLIQKQQYVAPSNKSF